MSRPGPDELRRRRDEVLAKKVAGGEISRYWLSFVKGEDFAGAAIVRAFGPADAIRQAWFRECNPGGEVQVAVVSDDFDIPAGAMNRLMSKDDLRMYFGQLVNGHGDPV